MFGGMIYGSILLSVLLLGFAYIVYVLANKEAGGIKTTGQVIAAVIAVFALWVFLYSGIYGGVMGRGICGRGTMRKKPGGMMYDKKDKYEFMEKMMEKPGMKEWMEEYMEEREKE